MTNYGVYGIFLSFVNPFFFACPSKLSLVLVFVCITVWGWGCGVLWLPVEIGGLAVGTDNKLGKFLSVKLRL